MRLGSILRLAGTKIRVSLSHSGPRVSTIESASPCARVVSWGWQRSASAETGCRDDSRARRTRRVLLTSWRRLRQSDSKRRLLH